MIYTRRFIARPVCKVAHGTRAGVAPHEYLHRVLVDTVLALELLRGIYASENILVADFAVSLFTRA